MSIKTLRESARLRQEDVAKKLNLNPSTVSKWENGVSFPSRKYHKKLAKLYGCTVADLLKEDKE